MRRNLALEEASEPEPGTSQPRDDQQSTRKTALSAMGDLFGDTYCVAVPAQDDPRVQLQNELMMYEQEPTLAPDSSPLAWWKKKCGKYPNLAKMAKIYLAVPGSSVRSERVFSDAGNIVNKKRASLCSENVDHLVFLANNLPKSQKAKKK